MTLKEFRFHGCGSIPLDDVIFDDVRGVTRMGLDDSDRHVTPNESGREMCEIFLDSSQDNYWSTNMPGTIMKWTNLTVYLFTMKMFLHLLRPTCDLFNILETKLLEDNVK